MHHQRVRNPADIWHGMPARGREIAAKANKTSNFPGGLKHVKTEARNTQVGTCYLLPDVGDLLRIFFSSRSAEPSPHGQLRNIPPVRPKNSSVRQQHTPHLGFPPDNTHNDLGGHAREPRTAVPRQRGNNDDNYGQRKHKRLEDLLSVLQPATDTHISRPWARRDTGQTQYSSAPESQGDAVVQ